MEIRIDQTNLYYEEHGQGLPVILLHGFPLDHTIWRKVVPALEAQARIIIPDLRGHGLSGSGVVIISMSRLADDLAALMDHLKIDRAAVVGHSMGGYASLAFARLFEERLAGLGLISTQAAADDPDKARGRLETANLIANQGITPVSDSMPQRLTQNPILQDEVQQIILRMDPQAAIGALYGMAGRDDLTRILPHIHIPTEIITGAVDQMWPRQRAVELSQSIPGAQWTEIPDVGHLPMLEAEQVVIERLIHLIHSVKQQTA